MKLRVNLSRSCERYSNAIEGVLETEGRRKIEVLQTLYGLRGRYMLPCLNKCKSVIEHRCPTPELHRSKSEYSHSHFTIHIFQCMPAMPT